MKVFVHVKKVEHLILSSVFLMRCIHSPVHISPSKRMSHMRDDWPKRFHSNGYKNKCSIVCIMSSRVHLHVNFFKCIQGQNCTPLSSFLLFFPLSLSSYSTTPELWRFVAVWAVPTCTRVHCVLTELDFSDTNTRVWINSEMHTLQKLHFLYLPPLFCWRVFEWECITNPVHKTGWW